MAFAPTLKVLRLISITPEAENWLFERLTDEPITIKEALSASQENQRVLSELLTQYVMFFHLNKHLKYPPEFLNGTSETVLGVHLIRYMAEQRWPFPHLLGK
jgi:hypothetical protein